MNKRQLIGVILAIASFLPVLTSSHIRNLSPEGQRCLALFVMVFFLYAFEVMSAAVISLAIVPLLVLMGITNIKGALSGFSASSTYLIVGAFILTGAMVKSRAGDRITYLILKLVGTRARNISFGIMCVSILLAFMIPSSTARTAMMLPICLKIIEQYQGDGTKKSRFGANIMMTLCFSNSAISAGILTSTITNPMAVEYIARVTGQTVTYRQWILWGGLPAFLCTLLGWGMIQLIFKPEKSDMEDGAAYVQEKLKEMGAVSVDEIKVLAVLAVAVALWFSGDRISLDSTTVCLICGCALCVPKLGYLTWEDCQKNISLNVLFVVSGGISLGAAMDETGTGMWLAENIFRVFGLEHLSAGVIIIATIVIVQFMHVFFAGTATMANVFFPVITGIAAVAHISPVILVMVTAFMIGGYPILMFFNTTPNILCYDTGQLSAGDFVRFGVLLSVGVCMVYAVCMKCYWPAVGMI